MSWELMFDKVEVVAIIGVTKSFSLTRLAVTLGDETMDYYALAEKFETTVGKGKGERKVVTWKDMWQGFDFQLDEIAALFANWPSRRHLFVSGS